nr:hypothetical protein CFP56_29020 [Quercus suber]POE68872.1 hypothetical protein CFP56_64972 [Quercus suber]
MDDILQDWKKLFLTEEDTKFSLSKSKNLRSKEFVLAAKFLTRRALNVEAIGRTFKPLWRAKKEFKVCEVGDHILLFVFETESDAERALANEPWTFDKHVVLLQRKTPFVVVPGMGDGLGGAPNSTQFPNIRKSIEMVIKSTGEKHGRSESREKDDADLRNGENWESRASGEQISLNGRDYRNPISEVSISNSNLNAFHIDNVAFEAQIQELDSEISKFDKCERHVENSSVDAPIVPPINEKQLTPSMQALATQDQIHHVTDNFPPSNQGSKTLRTWKRLARDNPMETDPLQSSTTKKRNREEEAEYLLELPIKKS